MEESRNADYQRTILRLKVEKFIYCNLFMDYCPEIKGNVYIYGAGKIGKLLLRCFEQTPIAFIDAKENLGDIRGVPVFCVNNILEKQFTGDNTVIVTPIWAYEEICNKLLGINARLNIVSLEKILEKM